MKDKQYMLMILDGVGINESEYGNAFKQANTPNIDKLMAKYATSHLKTSGLAVGLPEGQMGNSEVGHMTIGSGRVNFQDLSMISNEIQNESFYKNEALLEAMKNAVNNKSSLHIMGLLSDGGVHSHIEHIYALLAMAKRNGVEQVFIHAFMDGRDTPTSSGIEYIRKLENKCKEIGIGKIATISGRYYAMDRDKRWDRLQLVYNTMVCGEGAKFKSAEKAVENSYESQVFDEFIMPINICDENLMPIGLISSNDSVIFANFRPDRAREITHALTDNVFEGFIRKTGKVKGLKFICMTEYDSCLNNVKVAYKKEKMINTLGQFLEKRGYSQLRIAETEKYAHVTFFFNGGEEAANENETRILVPSPKVATYDMKPEMSALEVTEKVLEQIDKKASDCIIINYANGDMVGHTGDLNAAIKAMETIDVCVGKVIDAIESVGGEAIIIADHGNCEQMIDEKTGEVITSHTTFDVPIIVVSDRVKTVKEGSLADVAPTLIELMGLAKPKEMTGSSLIQFKK